MTKGDIVQDVFGRVGIIRSTKNGSHPTIDCSVNWFTEVAAHIPNLGTLPIEELLNLRLYCHGI